MQKFENIDVIAALEAIMHQNTAYYQSDFAYDIKMLREAAHSDQPEDKLLLWLSRPSGTFCFREWDVLLKDTQAYNTWKFCGEQPHDPELLQAVIRQEQRSREPARPGDFKEHLAALHTGLIEAEAQRIAADMKRLAAPNSPDKNHFMVEVSPENLFS